MISKSSKYILAILVARMDSTRVPGKSVLDINGTPLLELLIKNLLNLKGVDKLIVATSNSNSDDKIADICERLSLDFFRGDKEKVLDRLYEAANKFSADVIVEIGGDCPFIGPDVLDPAIEYFNKNNFDYLCNYEPPTYPEGFDINIITFNSLKEAYKKAIAPSQRIHPFSYLSFHRNKFKIGNIVFKKGDLSDNHWSLDFPEDVEFIKEVFKKLNNNKPTLEKVISLVSKDPLLNQMNKSLLRKKVDHSFWNAPSILKDMNNDVLHLVELGKDSIKNKEFSKSTHIYNEIIIITRELIAYSENMRKVI